MTSATAETVLSQSLIEQAEAVANDMKISPERLFALAIEDFIQRHRNRQLMEQMNEAYKNGPDPEDQELLLHMRCVQRKLLEDDEW